MKRMRRMGAIGERIRADKGTLLLLLVSILLLSLTAASMGLASASAAAAVGASPGSAEGGSASQQQHGQPVPTQVCACSGGSPAVAGPAAPPSLRGHRPPISTNYDEQIGITFTQSFTALEYNVTAVEQSDPTLGSGPAYLLNGLSDSGYWYQVGLAWDWSPGSDPGSGFDMTYEVFDQNGNSVFPQNGDGGLVGFSGPVDQGDKVILNLYFSNSSQVVMFAEDTKTGASASETFSQEGATYFVGLPSGVANSNGYFTGLMTECTTGPRSTGTASRSSTRTRTPLSPRDGCGWTNSTRPTTGCSSPPTPRPRSSTTRPRSCRSSLSTGRPRLATPSSS